LNKSDSIALKKNDDQDPEIQDDQYEEEFDNEEI
jgi:hypothetical protein